MTNVATVQLEMPTILIVDDTPANLAIVVESLENHGLRVVVAQDGNECLQRADYVKPDLILLDVMMPGQNGFEVCRLLKSNAATSDIPVIFMTSLTDPEDVLSGFKAGAVDYVTKPLRIDEVVARIDAQLKLRALQQQLAEKNTLLEQYRQGLEQEVAARTAELSERNRQLQGEISERRRIDAALRESEQKFRTLAVHVPDVIVRYDRQCRRTFVNPAYYKETGILFGQAQGKAPTELWRPDNISAEAYQAKLQQVMDSGVAADILLEYPGPDGRIVSNAVRAVAEYDQEGQVVGVLSIGRNITEIKRHEHLEKARVQIFERLAQGGSLQEVLDLIVGYVEKAHPDYLGSIMLVAADGKSLVSGAGASLPEAYTSAIDGIAIDEGVGACGTAAFRGQTVIAEDIRSDPYWVPYKALALKSGLQACWSEPIFDSTGKVLGTFGIYLRQPGSPSADEMIFVRQVSHIAAIAIERKRAEELLWESEHKYRTLVEDSPDLIIRYDRDCRRTYVGEAYAQMHGKLPEEVLGKRPTEIWGSARMTAEAFEQRLKHVMETGERAEIELDWTTPQGEYFCHWMRAVPEYDREGNVVSVLSITRDVSEFKRTEQALHLHEQELRSLVENTPDTIARYDTNCRRIYANPQMLRDLGAPLAQAINKKPSEFPGGESAAAYEAQIRKVLESGESEDFELTWKGNDGKQIVSYIRLTPEFGVDGEVASVLAVGRDITEIDEYRQSIHHLAFYDLLTELPNRALLTDRIHQTIADASWHGYRFGLMMLDLDRFKEVNDTLGHGVGDLLLREAAARLMQSVRIYDTVARLGGDEFAILLPQVREGDDLAVIARKIIEVFQLPFNLAGKELFISASIGIALYPSDSSDIDALFKYADSAMYHAKKLGRNNFQFYAKELTARSTERMALESSLRKVVKNHELELYYQPQVDLATGRIVGAEALLRWNNKDAGVMTPDKFIPVAEETGLIVPMGEWALTAACLVAAEWNQGRSLPLKVAVNLSTRQFIRNDLLDSVRRILNETRCDPAWLKLEITESLLLEDSAEILEVLEALDDMGLAISIDDFGTGYSALSYLNRFPVRQIKIDRSFVNGIPDNQDKSELVKAMISIAHALQLELVAEGVETLEQADYLNLHGCLVGQGYLFGKPMPLAEFKSFLSERAS